MKAITILKSGVGVNNRIAPHRLPFGDGGVSALEGSNDVVIDRTGEVTSRRGTSSLDSAPSHSLCKTEGGFYVCQDRASDSVIRKATVDTLDGSITMANVASGLTIGAKVSYTPPLDGKVYFSNGFQSGCLFGDIATTWTGSEWSLTDLPEYSVPVPIGKHLGLLSGRILISLGAKLIFTEYGHPGIYNEAEGVVRFESDVIMVAPVETGVFVSDRDSIYFLNGSNPEEWTIRKVCQYPAREYGSHLELVEPTSFGVEAGGLAALMATEQGPCVGLQDGTIINLIKGSLALPQDCGIEGCIMVVDETIILQSGE